MVHGHPLLGGLGITEEKVEALTRLPTRKDDIFIASYPRSGSAWTQEIVWQIIHDGKVDNRRLAERVPFIEGMIVPVKSYPYTVTDVESLKEMFTGFPSPRVFQTHLPYNMVPKGHNEATKPRYIYVVRNPKDVCVSLYHYYQDIPYMPEIPTWNQAFQRFMKGRVVYGGLWFDQVLSWWKQRDDPNILFLTYEDRTKNPGNAVEKIAKFIGKEISPETRDRIVQQTSFGAMKSSEHTNYTWVKGMKKNGYFRKGKVGQWKNYFTEEQDELFDNVFNDKLTGTGLIIDFEG